MNVEDRCPDDVFLRSYTKIQNPARGIHFKAASSVLTHFELALNKICTLSVDGLPGLPCLPGFHRTFVQNVTLLHCHLQWLRDHLCHGKSAWGKDAIHSCSTALIKNLNGQNIILHRKHTAVQYSACILSDFGCLLMHIENHPRLQIELLELHLRDVQ